MSQSVNGYPEYLTASACPASRTFPAWKKFTEIRHPTPSQLFVFIDEHPDTMLDAQFGNPAGMPPYWAPSGGTCPPTGTTRAPCLSFADGHVERWRWKVPKVAQYIGQPATAQDAARFPARPERP